MARKSEKQSKGLGRLQSAASAVKNLFTRGRRKVQEAQSPMSASSRPAQSSAAATTTRQAKRVEADIPLDVLERAYTPSTSSKASFRSDGSDHQSDQEYAFGVADDRWNDEDRLTNKSGDPRIGTRGRTYEPGEARPESRE